MEILPIITPLLTPGMDLASTLFTSRQLQAGDIVVVSSKAMATVEGAAVALSSLTISAEAQKLSKQCNQSPAFTQAVLDETKRLNGHVAGTCPWALLTSVRPEGMEGSLLIPNAGMDKSNVEEGCAIGWPVEPVEAVTQLRRELETLCSKRGTEGTQGTKGTKGQKNTPVPSAPLIPLVPCRLAVILSDSCCRPGRLGVTAFALTVSGIEPFASQVGRKDLFGHSLRFTQEAVADQLATAANAVMGNADQSTPAAIIRGHGLILSEYEGWVPGMEPAEDLFREIFVDYSKI